MRPHTPEIQPPANTLRTLFPVRPGRPNGDSKSHYPLEDPKLVMAAVDQACAHQLIYRSSDHALHLTLETELRLLNVKFTAGLEAVASRTANNPFSEIVDERLPSADDPFPYFEQQLALVTHRHIVRDDPNALGELFTDHFVDLRAYLTGKAIPTSAFLMTCGVFVARFRRQRPSLHMSA